MMSNTSSDMEHCSNLTKESEFSGLLYTSTLNSGTVVDVCCFCYYYYYYQAESTTLLIGVLPSHSPLAERCPREKFPLKAGLLFTRGATMRKKWKENRRIFFFAGIAQWPMYSKRWNLVKLYWIYSSFLYEVNKREHRTAALKKLPTYACDDDVIVQGNKIKTLDKPKSYHIAIYCAFLHLFLIVNWCYSCLCSSPLCSYLLVAD